MKFIVGFIIIAVGFVMIWQTQWFINSLGRIAWAEQKLGGGGTWTFYKIVGVLAIFLAFLIMTGDIIKPLDWLFGN